MNVTLSIDESVMVKARKLASARGTSVNQLIRDYLEALVRPAGHDDFAGELRRLSAEGKGRSKGWRFDREALHERR